MSKNNEPTVFILVVFLICVLVLGSTIVGVMYGRNYTEHRRANIAERDVAWWRKTFQIKNGSDSKFGDYFLVSMDGKTWYERKTNDGTVTLEPAQEGLMKRLEAWDRMTNLKQPLDLSNPADVQVLRDFGLTVEMKEPAKP